MMDLIKLEDNLKLNITEIDSQHETLINLINAIHETMLQGADKADLDRLLSQLLEHTRSHFSYEEELMSRYSYAEYETHKSEHNRLMEHLEDLAVRYHSGELLLSFAIVLELKGWATIHIEKSDKPLGTFLSKQHGFETAPA
jgi:hemerythrin